MEMTIPKLIGAWAASGERYAVHPPATEKEIRAAEKKIGAKLPKSLRDLYACCDGGLTMDLVLFSLEPQPPGYPWALANGTEDFIENDYLIPKELRLFASEGGAFYYGIWFPEIGESSYNHPVIELARELIDTEGCMSIAGTNLVSFLLGWSAYYVQSPFDRGPSRVRQERKALDILQVPQHLRHDEFHANIRPTLVEAYNQPWINNYFSQLRKWADPQLPAPYGNAFDHQFSIADLKSILR